MNYASFGRRNTDWLIQHADQPCLLISDPPTADLFLQHKQGRIFDPLKHSFNPLANMNYARACDFVEIMRYLFPAGHTTLTREEADHLMLEALLDEPTTLVGLIAGSTDPGARKAQRLIERLTLSPVLRSVLTGKRQFDFSGTVVVPLDRTKLGNFDCLALALFLIGQYQGQIVIDDFVFYGRPIHVSLIQQHRLTCHVRRLGALAEGMAEDLLQIEHKSAGGTTHADAVTLADYMCPFQPGQNDYIKFIEEAMA